MTWTVAILGATGAVGRVMRTCLEASSIEVGELRLLATPRSEGASLPFQGRDVRVQAVSPDAFQGVDLALFSAGASASGDWAGVARAAGAWVVDNSSRWRMDPEVPLVVPEVNPHAIPAAPALIANPNCSTIQMVAALQPIHARYGIHRVIVSTYQAVSGTGEKGIRALEMESERWRTEAGHTGESNAFPFSYGSPDAPPAAQSPYPHPILGNVIPQCDVVLEDGYTREEQKMIDETRKIMELPDLIVQPTCVRVPVVKAHSEAVYVETNQPANVEDVRTLLSQSPGIALLDDPHHAAYPLPRKAAETDPVWVGRIRKDRCVPNGLHLWVVADNLRKGAALNALQIAEQIWERAAR
ncbi:MAG: aspartate-semialdehyde dehydrogenase [Candidatus Eisenbacteria bacterium]|uniref:Aspartate-semialdehyde dehydrogenase n=1 Tax=Eiseniibacteriota bacterium TaxID=2212470 RepID=A0A956NE99_UNCEI|nr:aspartate-semialdehyde dehydrogenase [Candidatus Eisenbacteria bacterium]MCB9462834.1 aspartate-semialdehyde dehydrogenase [Candidatus Eisenbacteria bacterium]